MTGEPPAGADEKPEDADRPDDAEKPEDEDPVDPDLQPPEGLSDKSRERFQTLVEKTKTLAEERDTLQANLKNLEPAAKTWQEFTSYSQATPDELVELAEYSRAVKTGDLEAAARIIDRHRADIYKAMGREAPGVDVLGDFPDIKQAVGNFQITKDHALELARQRRQQAVQDAERQRAESAAQAQQSSQQEVQRAQARIAELAATWQKGDIDYPAKERILREQAPDIMANYPPARWAAELETRYNLISKATGVGAAARRTPSPARPQAASPGSAPTTMLSAITQGLTELRSR